MWKTQSLNVTRFSEVAEWLCQVMVDAPIWRMERALWLQGKFTPHLHISQFPFMFPRYVFLAICPVFFSYQIIIHYGKENNLSIAQSFQFPFNIMRYSLQSIFISFLCVRPLNTFDPSLNLCPRSKSRAYLRHSVPMWSADKI